MSIPHSPNSMGIMVFLFPLLHVLIFQYIVAHSVHIYQTNTSSLERRALTHSLNKSLTPFPLISLVQMTCKYTCTGRSLPTGSCIVWTQINCAFRDPLRVSRHRGPRCTLKYTCPSSKQRPSLGCFVQSRDYTIPLCFDAIPGQGASWE